jgi:hypothetical protein
MKLRETLVTFLALAAIGFASYFANRYETRPNPSFCNICNRPIHRGMAFLVETDGHTEHACRLVVEYTTPSVILAKFRRCGPRI